MSTDFGQWDRVASELRACREAQQQAWGDVDNATLGRYLADDVTLEERRRIETELRRHPELRKLTDLVSDIIRDCEPVAAPERAGPSVLPFSAAKPRPHGTNRRWRQWTAVAAAACLLFALGYTVLPKGFSPPTSFPRGDLAMKTVGIRTNTAAFHPTLAPGDSEPGSRPARASKDAAKSATPLDHVAVYFADGCAQAADSYQRHGDLDLAEFSYKLAYGVREWKLGPDAEQTVQARRNLGAVYQTALNQKEDALFTPGGPSPTAPAAVADKGPGQEIQFSAALLRERLAQQPAAEVSKSVVPVLVANLNDAKTPEEREQLGRALAELGPAAKDAVPALDACLQKRDLTPREREAVLEAKQRLEKAAWPADAPAPRP